MNEGRREGVVGRGGGVLGEEGTGMHRQVGRTP